MFTLYEDGLRKVAEGVTSLDELLRVTEDASDA
jgi:general secretion pathway protein E